MTQINLQTNLALIIPVLHIINFIVGFISGEGFNAGYLDFMSDSSISFMDNSSPDSARDIQDSIRNNQENVDITLRFSGSNDLARKLEHQIAYNQPRQSKLPYNGFDSRNPGYLNINDKTRLCSILERYYGSDNAEYRFGSSLGQFYYKNTYRHPEASQSMVDIVKSFGNFTFN